jgi:hypothetical protein
VFADLTIESPRPRRVLIRVLLRAGALELEGQDEGVDEARSRVQAAARATVKALERDLEEAGVVLEGVKVVDAFDHGEASVPRRREEWSAAGSCQGGCERLVVLVDFLAVHRKGGNPCPRCGKRISEVASRSEATSWCRGCQR